jgi:hypothetical protein
MKLQPLSVKGGHTVSRNWKMSRPDKFVNSRSLAVGGKGSECTRGGLTQVSEALHSILRAGKSTLVEASALFDA